MTEADKIDLAIIDMALQTAINRTRSDDVSANAAYRDFKAARKTLESLSTRLKDLEEAKEALEWLINDMPKDDIEMLVGESFNELPPYLQRRLGDKK